MSCGGNRLFNRNAALIADLTKERRGQITREEAARLFHKWSATHHELLTANFESANGRRPNREEAKEITQEAHAAARRSLPAAVDRHIAEQERNSPAGQARAREDAEQEEWDEKVFNDPSLYDPEKSEYRWPEVLREHERRVADGRSGGPVRAE